LTAASYDEIGRKFRAMGLVVDEVLVRLWFCNELDHKALGDQGHEVSRQSAVLVAGTQHAGRVG
jgi:hypothetical protein